MKVLHASLLFTNDGPPVVNADLVLTEEGVIVEISSGGASNKNDYRDVVIPAFVNAHCHLELSHLKGLIRERKRDDRIYSSVAFTTFSLFRCGATGGYATR